MENVQKVGFIGKNNLVLWVSEIDITFSDIKMNIFHLHLEGELRKETTKK